MRVLAHCVCVLVVVVGGPGSVTAQHACDPQRLAPPPDVPPTSFGSTAVTNGRSWLVGDKSARTWCPGDPFSCSAGAVVAYEEFDGALEQVQTIVPPDVQQGMKFGDALAIHGDELIVGVPGRRWTDTEVLGGAFAYRFADGRWTESERIQPPPGAAPEQYDYLGGWVAFDESLAILRSEIATSSILAVYARTPEGWTFRESLEAPDGVPDDAYFGENPALSDDWLFVTARDDSTAADRAGSVYAYRRHGDDSLEFVQKLYAPDPQERDRFGYSIDHQGTTLVVGAFLADRPFDGQGLVFVYGLENDRWVLRQEIALGDARRNDGFGAAVHLDGKLLLVQARGRRDGTSSGRVFRFERDAAGHWYEIGQLVPNPPVYAGSYGWAMDSAGGASGMALVGAHDDVTLPADQYGAAYFFDLACNPCRPDLDLDGALTIFDFLAFLNLFEDGEAAADFDGDGALTIFDFLAFQTAFQAGC